MSYGWNKAGNGQKDMVADSRTILRSSENTQAVQHSPKLLELFREALSVRHYSNRTEESCCVNTRGGESFSCSAYW